MSSTTPEATSDSVESEFLFTVNWFETTARSTWDWLIPQIKPRKILEIGSYEGASACYLIQRLAQEFPIEIHCIDPWISYYELSGYDMNAAESRFHQNTKHAIASVPHPVTLSVHKAYSKICLAQLLSQGYKNYFDFIYVDGSHNAPEVLTDAVLSFQLLRVGGVMAFDDYLWFENLPYGKDPLRCPKPAIDAFVNINYRQLNVISAPLSQLYITKISE